MRMRPEGISHTSLVLLESHIIVFCCNFYYLRSALNCPYPYLHLQDVYYTRIIKYFYWIIFVMLFLNTYIGTSCPYILWNNSQTEKENLTAEPEIELRTSWSVPDFTINPSSHTLLRNRYSILLRYRPLRSRVCQHTAGLILTCP